MEIDVENIDDKYKMMELICEIFQKSRLNIHELEESLKEVGSYYNLNLQNEEYNNRN